jgi:hypothetical protein
MNKQIYGCVCIAIFNNPVANFLSRNNFEINTEKLLRYNVSNISFWEAPTIQKGRQFKEQASVGAIGIIMQPTSACQTATTQPTQTVIETIITVGVASGLLLSPGLLTALTILKYNIMNIRLPFLVPLIMLLTQQGFAQAIFSGGNDDGFTVSYYAQSDNPTLAIFSGGNDDGFGFSFVDGVGTEVPLPIALINFIANVQDNLVNLKWQTASEINNYYFTIEKSKTASNWVIVTQVNGAGNSSNVLSYSTTDQTPYNGISYYRLKQTDFNGQFEYSDIRAVNFERTKAEVVIYPNPTNNQITIQANEQELQNIKIYNVLGQDVTNSAKQLSKSENGVIIDLSNLANGIYSVRTQTTANKVYKK